MRAIRRSKYDSIKSEIMFEERSACWFITYASQHLCYYVIANRLSCVDKQRQI